MILIWSLASLASAPARADELVFAVISSRAMPMADLREGELTGGLLKDFGDALARELRMTPRYLPLPRKRIEDALGAGKVDLLCDQRPEWLEGKQWQWSDVVFNNFEVVATRADTRAPLRVAALGNQRVGTVLGYRYPEIESVLGERFLRDEAETEAINMTKLLRGRFNYAMDNALHYEFQRMVHPERRRLHPAPYRVRPIDTYCAMPRDGKVSLQQVNRAIASLRRRGDMEASLDRYRPLR